MNSDEDINVENDDPMEGALKNAKFTKKKIVFDFECGFDSNRYHYPNMAAIMCLRDDAVSLTFCGLDCAEEMLQWILETPEAVRF